MGGWWKIRSSDLDPAEWPADMEVSATPTAPRAWSKITNLVASNSHYLGGTPSAVIDGVLYYVGDDYTLGVTRPPINSWNGTLAAEVVRIPLAGSTVPIAILSMVVHSGILYLSTLDSGTTSTTWAGRVFKFNPETQSLVTFGSDSFTAGKIPYSLAVLGGKLWVGTHRQDPTLYGEIWSINLSTEVTTREQRMSDGILDPPTISSVVHTRASTTYSYKVRSVNADSEASNSSETATNVSNDGALSGTVYNTISWGAVTGAASYNVFRTAGGATQGKIANTASTSFVDDGDAGDASSPGTTTLPTPITAVNDFNIGFINGGAATTYTYEATILRGGVESLVSPTRTTTTGPTTLDATHYIELSVGIAGLPSYQDGATTVNVYRRVGGATQGIIAAIVPVAPFWATTFRDDGDVGDGTVPPIASPTISSVVATKPSETNTYKVTARTASGATTESNAVSVSAKTTLDASNYNTITWGAVSVATSYDVYRTVGFAPLGKITNTASVSFVDDGDAGDASSPPTENGSGVNKGGVTSLMPLDTSLFIGLANTSGTFAEVWKRSAAGVYATSTTATGGTATTYNGFTAMGTFGTSLYAAYWNQDTTKICKIYKYDGSTWSTVLTIDGGDIVPILRFHTEEGVLMAIGGGRQQYGILYRTVDGTTWEDCTGLMPSAVEGLPVVGSIRIPV